mgnify:FL=1|tara:strand:+ start:411 stop:683 length:273 start_codon:yes stop_codon:yes gene_type:complete
MIITSNVYNDYLTNINFRTALLESLDWNEDDYEDLILYLNSEFKRNDVSPKEIIDFLKEHFSTGSALIIENMFKEVYITIGMPIPNSEEN